MSFFLQLSCVLGDLERKRRFLCSNSLYQILNLQTWKLHSTTLSKFIPGNEIYLHVPTLEAICLLAECNSTIPKINILDPHERIIFQWDHPWTFPISIWNLKFKNTILGEKQLNYLDFFSSLWLIRVLFCLRKGWHGLWQKNRSKMISSWWFHVCMFLALFGKDSHFV